MTLEERHKLYRTNPHWSLEKDVSLDIDRRIECLFFGTTAPTPEVLDYRHSLQKPPMDPAEAAKIHHFMWSGIEEITTRP